MAGLNGIPPGMQRNAASSLVLALGLLLLSATGASAEPDGGKVVGLDDLLKAQDKANTAANLPQGLTQVSAFKVHVGVDGQRYVTLDALSVPGEAKALVQQLHGLGARDIAVATDDITVSFRIPVASAAALNSIASLRFAAPAAYVLAVGSVTSQGDKAMRTDVLKSTVAGLDGSGVRVCVMSDSYNVRGGAAADVASGDLPSGVIVVREAAELESTDEGRAMLQLIHDVAPGALLSFHTANGGQAAFANGIRTLANSGGCKVIVDDVRYLFEPMFQGGVIDQAVNEVYTSKKVLYYTSAGNEARQAWETRAWHEDSVHRYIFDAAAGGNRVFQTVRVGAGDTIRITLQWDQPYDNSQVDIDMAAYTGDPRLSGSTRIANDNVNNIGGNPLAFLSLTNGGSVSATFALVLTRVPRGSASAFPGRVKYVYYCGSSSTGPTTDITNSAAVFGHPMATGAFAVGAADFRRTPAFSGSTAQIEKFSSTGGGSLLFDTTGRRITPFVPRKPDAVAPDGTDTTFFGQAISDGNSFPNFFGTSAAAPHVAALAALLLQKRPALTPFNLNTILRTTADDMDSPYAVGFELGHDTATGSGLVNGLSAYQAAVCRSSCGPLTIVWPFNIDAGCGPDEYKLTCGFGVVPLITLGSNAYIVSQLKRDQILIESARNNALTTYACPGGGGSDIGPKQLSTIGSPYSINGANIIMAYGSGVQGSFGTFDSSGAGINFGSCRASCGSPSSGPAFCNKTSASSSSCCCSVPLGSSSRRATLRKVADTSCGGVDILYPPAVKELDINKANAPFNYFVRLDYAQPNRPRGTQGCSRFFWSATFSRCRWPYDIQFFTTLITAFATTLEERSLIASSYPASTTLQEALTAPYSTGEPYDRLGAQAVTALLNAYQTRYPLLVSEVKAKFIAALRAADPAAQIDEFDRNNHVNRWCPFTAC